LVVLGKGRRCRPFSLYGAGANDFAARDHAPATLLRRYPRPLNNLIPAVRLTSSFREIFHVTFRATRKIIL
jgi:hypothetical protein